MKKELKNEMKVKFSGIAENEAFARICISGFIVKYGITAAELADVKTAVSEAVTNSIVHGYKEKKGDVVLTARLYSDGELYISVSDNGCGIEDIKKAREPFFTTDSSSERCGMGFSIMDSFMSHLRVYSKPGYGTRITMTKMLSGFEKAPAI